MNTNPSENLKSMGEWLKGSVVLQMSPDANLSPLFRPQGQGQEQEQGQGQEQEQEQGQEYIEELSLNNYLPGPILKLTRQIACFTQSTISIQIK